MRQLLEAVSTPQRLRSFWQRNLVTLAMLWRNLPDLKTNGAEHYIDILKLFIHCLRIRPMMSCQ
jgi:hypothetical protein